MARDLVVTNGDAAACLLAKAGIGDEILPWRDILYEGPVPHSLPLAELSDIRADYLASRYPRLGKDIAGDFRARDSMLARHGEFDTITLWFEHDLHDMLQLLQLLDYFATAGRDRADVRIVHTDRHLTTYSAGAMKGAAASVKPVGTARFNQAREAWARWREPDPRLWAALANRSRLGIKHLWIGVLTTFDLYPLQGRGISRLELAILDQIATRPAKPGALFEAVSQDCDREHGRYMGDWSFFAIIDRLASGPAPLVAGLASAPFRPSSPAASRRGWHDSIPALTILGRRVRAGEADWSDHTSIDRWVGGCHITNAELWQYDQPHNRIIAAGR